MGHLLRNMREALDPGGLGIVTGTHAQLCMFASLGQFIPLNQTLAVLLVRRLYATPGPWMICGAVEAGEESIESALAWAVEASMGYQYCAGRLYPNGQVSRYTEPTRIDIDGDGEIITPRLPMWPTDLIVKPAAGGAFAFRWAYNPFGQGGPPTDFQVFEGTTAAGIDYETPLTDAATSETDVDYIADQVRYSMTCSDAWNDGTLHYFGVRARNSGGVAEQNTYASGPHVAMVTVPGAPTIRELSQRRI